MVDSSLFQKDIRKILKTFCVVGLNESKITRYKEDDTIHRFVQNVDIIQKNMKVNLQKLEYENEKW
jgi:hypothetical protein